MIERRSGAKRKPGDCRPCGAAGKKKPAPPWGKKPAPGKKPKPC